jgi:hypothetical protein
MSETPVVGRIEQLGDRVEGAQARDAFEAAYSAADKAETLQRLDGLTKARPVVAIAAPSCASCRYQVAADRNCQIVMFAAGVEVRMMEKRGERAVPRPGDPRFCCALYEATR